MKQPEGADVAFARWQAPLTAEGRWRSAAACRSADPEVFFPISNTAKSLEQIAKAKAICASCPVGRECLAFALRTHQPQRFRGGARLVTGRVAPVFGGWIGFRCSQRMADGPMCSGAPAPTAPGRPPSG